MGQSHWKWPKTSQKRHRIARPTGTDFVGSFHYQGRAFAIARKLFQESIRSGRIDVDIERQIKKRGGNSNQLKQSSYSPWLRSIIIIPVKCDRSPRSLKSKEDLLNDLKKRDGNPAWAFCFSRDRRLMAFEWIFSFFALSDGAKPKVGR